MTGRQWLMINNGGESGRWNGMVTGDKKIIIVIIRIRIRIRIRNERKEIKKE